MNKELEKIEADRKKIRQNILEYVRSKKEQWKKLPWYCLQTDGLSGYSDHDQACYAFKKWYLQSSDHGGNYNLHINCNTGKIMWANSPAQQDCDYLDRLDLEELDIDSIIKNYQKELYDDKHPKKGDYVFPNKRKQSEIDILAKEYSVKNYEIQ